MERGRTEVGLGVGADLVELDQPLFARGRRVGRGRAEADALVAELGKLLAPERARRRGVDVSLAGTVGPGRGKW